MAEIKHIAVFRLSAMGDVAMTVPVLRAFVKQFPEVKITVVSRPFFKPFFDGSPNVEFFQIDLKERHKGFFGLIRLFLDLKRLKIDAFADLHNVLRSKIVRNLFTLGGKKTASVDKGRAEKKALTRSKNKIFKPVTSMFERHAKVFQELGFNVNLKHPKFPEKANLSEEIIKITSEKNSQNWIGIAPFAQYDSKVYPQDLMQKVIDQLSENKNNTIFLFGGGNKEIEILNQFASNKNNVVNIAGKINFQDELKLISNLNVMLSMDSGNGHIAAMLGVKVVTLWGATHPFAGFMPFNQPLENSITPDLEKFPLLPTSVYGNKFVESYGEAMRSVEVESVVKKVEENLKK